MSERRVVHRVCPFCEATCGLAIEVEDTAVVSVRGNKHDPFSRGYICPKVYSLKERLSRSHDTTDSSALAFGHFQLGEGECRARRMPEVDTTVGQAGLFRAIAPQKKIGGLEVSPPVYSRHSRNSECVMRGDT